MGQFAVLERPLDGGVAVLRADKGIVVDKRAGPAQDAGFDVIRCPDGRAVVAGRRHDVHVPEAALPHQPAVRHAVEGDAAGDHQVLLLRALAQLAGERQDALLELLLEGGGHIQVVLLEFGPLGLLAGLAERLEELPAAARLVVGVVEVREVHADGHVIVDPEDLLHDAAEGLRVAQGREPHGLALVVIGPEPAELGGRLVYHAQRVGEVVLTEALERGAPPHPLEGRGPLAPPVHREQGGALVRADIEGAHRVGEMVGDEVYRRRRACAVRRFQPGVQHVPPAPSLQHVVLDDGHDPPAQSQSVGQFPGPVQARLVGDRDMVYLSGRQSGDLQAARDRLLGERVRMLPACQPLLFERDHQRPIPDDAGRRVVVDEIDTQNVHVQPRTAHPIPSGGTDGSTTGIPAFGI